MTNARDQKKREQKKLNEGPDTACSQKQGYGERQEKRYDRMSKYSLEPDDQRMYGARAKVFWEKAEAYKGIVNNSAENIESPEKPYVEVQEEYFNNATPGEGKLEFDPDCISEQHKKLYENEVAFAKWLHKTLGGSIHVFAEVNVGIFLDIMVSIESCSCTTY